MLSREDILGYRKHGQIVIEPFEPRNLGTNSYDVTLGEWFYRERRPDLGFSKVYNIYDGNQVLDVWGDHPIKANTTYVELPPHLDLKNIGEHDRVILLEPGETVLCHTREFIGGLDCITTMMKARSSFGRNFIEVCKCAGLGDVGYINRWTMEVTNNSRFYHIPLVVGRRIAQITFFKTGNTGDYGKGGKYQEGGRLEELVEVWKPEMMLPRLQFDWEVGAEQQPS